MMENTLSIEPVVKILELDVAPGHAFDVFTKQMGAWWPVLNGSATTTNRAGTSLLEPYVVAAGG